MTKKTDPWAEIESWGRKLAKTHGLQPTEVTYDSDMMHLVFKGAPDAANLKTFHEAAQKGDFIKAPYKVGDLTDSTEDMADEGESVFTLSFYIPE